MFDLDTSTDGLRGGADLSATGGAFTDFAKVKSVPLALRPGESTDPLADEAVDLSALVLEYKRLKEQAEKRERELSTLLEVSRSVSSTLELGSVLQLILDWLSLVLDFAGAAVFELKGQQLVVAAYFDRAVVSGDHLGLKIMKERTEAIEGEISVESQMGRGTRVRVKWRDREKGVLK